MTDAQTSSAQAALNLVKDAQFHLRKFRVGHARHALERALEVNPNCLEAHNGLAQIRFPGLPYLDLLGHIHKQMRPETYVEIGVATGISMAQALPSTRCIGIDPAPTLQVPCGPSVQVFVKTSDDFFAQHDVTELLGGKPVRLGFIDGLHLFENVLSDFMNLERYCEADSTLMIHDCMPLNELVAARQRQTHFWTGDVWRILPTLAKFRPDLSIAVVMTPPSGLAIVRKLDPASQVLAHQREEAIAYGNSVGFSALENLGQRGIHIVQGDLSAVAAFAMN